eukprot:CAMPEP_0177575660 /NCGR_PEP_ID=MMETSP0369-20130122/79730_1 /TAXON_ID=447022 ORGANISM="Scrippsiella hangoei-like, Strain SHHI-4" /NCGR_SAMPLE_ID=MMETSP0369 /ASSEMBLY_ACC=CAM_ASM_000364 /LENGTH=111 /DNA_ID=CAMNT_0019063955 /DNA_START=743 /DNA_END=1078 /DNA_ORIENTATION=-
MSKHTCNFSSMVPRDNADMPQASSAKASWPTLKASNLLNNRAQSSLGNSGTALLTNSVKASKLKPSSTSDGVRLQLEEKLLVPEGESRRRQLASEAAYFLDRQMSSLRQAH